LDVTHGENAERVDVIFGALVLGENVDEALAGLDDVAGAVDEFMDEPEQPTQSTLGTQPPTGE
jgi:hypothetical protein